MSEHTKFKRFIDKTFPMCVCLYYIIVREPILKRVTRYAIIAPLNCEDVVLFVQSPLGVISFSHFVNLNFALSSISSHF